MECLLNNSSLKNQVSAFNLIQIALHAARGMAYLHDQGLVHKDMKTANLMLDSKGTVIVVVGGGGGRRGGGTDNVPFFLFLVLRLFYYDCSTTTVLLRLFYYDHQWTTPTVSNAKWRILGARN